MRRYGRILRYALGEWRTFLLVSGLTLAASGVAALQPWPLKVLVDFALGGAPLPDSPRLLLEEVRPIAAPVVLVIAAALGSVALFALRSAVDTGLSWAWAAAGQRMVHALAADLFHRLQRLSSIFHSRRTVGDTLNRLTTDTWCVYTVCEGLLITPAQQIVLLATLSAVAFRLDPGLALPLLGIAPALGASAYFFGRRLKRNAGMNRAAHSRLTSFVHQTLTAIPIVQAFGTEERNGYEYRRLAADAVSLSRRGTFLKDAYTLANGLITTVGVASILYLAGRRVLAGSLSVGSLLVFLGYLQSMQGAWQSLLGTYGSLKSAGASVDRVLEILDFGGGVMETPGARRIAGKSRGHVRVEGVTFGYEAGRAVLQGVSVEARPGERVALVGKTGAGKSTLVSLIPRFYDPWAGRVSLDGVDVRLLRLGSLRAQVSLVLQEPFLLPLTVAENIAYGRPGAGRGEIERAAAAANAEGFIRRLPRGYETVLGERGATLSGGERQRLAIARALLKDAPVLILDEPTSALDAETEWELLEALGRLMAGRTVFVIAHRLSTIRGADRVAVLEGGRVAEEGSHEALFLQGGLYRRLCNLQFGQGVPVGGAA